jgi:UDP-N-acetylmuramyl pentapeptide phosphotransferase/UDP-N-acetylglucosamine-1-phosphate transferase
MAFHLALTTVAAALIAAALVVALHPLLRRYALARPNARSSHRTPTPQGGGIAVIGAAILAMAGAGLLGFDVNGLAPVLAAAVVLALLGAADDIRPLAPGVRLAFQTVAVAVVALAAGPDSRLIPAVPRAVESATLILAGIWFVNVVNFMDGIDWMSVAELVPLTAALAFLGGAGGLPTPAPLLAAALLGGLLGFAPFNKPVAQLFLGDVGSLPLGLLVGWLLIQLAGTGAWAAALLLPLYYLADATLTLLRRLARGERIWQAHRQHFYHQALVNGLSVPEIVARVFTLNLALAALAGAALLWPSISVSAATLAAGTVLVALTLRRFASPRAAEPRPAAPPEGTP